MQNDELVGVEPVKGHSELIELHFRDGGPLQVPLRAFVDMNCKLGMAIGPDLYQQFQDEAATAQAKEYALKRLVRRAMTVKEVQFALHKQEFAEPVIQTVIEDLSRMGVLNDQLYAENFALSKGRKLSRTELVWRLSQRGVPSEVAEQAVQIEAAGDREYEAAFNFATKFWRRHERDEESLRAQKLGASLQRRGFSMDVIRRVIRAFQRPLS